MATLPEIWDAMKARLVAYYESQGQPVNVYATVPGQVVTTAVIVEPIAGAYHRTLTSGTDHTLALHLLAHFGDRDAAQRTVAQMLSETGALSVVAAIHADRTLGGVVSYADPQSYRDYGTRRYGEVDYLMATVEVAITA